MFPQPPCYLLANSCLNTTQAPIKIPKTKNYYSRHSGAKQYFEKLFMNVSFWLHNMNYAKINKKHHNSCTFRQSSCAHMYAHLSHLQMQTHVLGPRAHLSARVCVISAFWVSKGPRLPYGALALELWGECRSCHYNWWGKSSESCYLKAHQH